jgi:alkaline phosphatase D
MQTPVHDKGALGMTNQKMNAPSFDRARGFLKSLLTGSALFLVDNMTKGPIHAFSRTADAAQAAVSASRYPRFQPRFAPGIGFPQSVASGDPTSTGAILWTRVDPTVSQGLGGNRVDPSLVQWMQKPDPALREDVIVAIRQGQFVQFEISENANFSCIVLSGFAPIYKDYDHIVKVDVDGCLRPQKTYYYRFITRSGHVSRTGRFKTLPASGASVRSVRFGYVSCADYTNGYYHAYRFLAEEELDFVIHLGDYVYESVGDPTYQSPLPDRQIRLPGGKSKAFTLADYRTLYQTYRSDPDLQRLHEKHAMIAIWDDHEFANNTYFPAVAPDDSLESDPSRRLAANRVWFEYMPARVVFDERQTFDRSIRIYCSFTWGNLAEFVFTDQRLYRSAHPCGKKEVGRFLSPGCPRMNDPNQTMLGSEQKTWFLNRMKSSTALWKIWANEVQFTPLKLYGQYLNLDAWDGYAGERRQLTEALKEAGLRNWIVITGDLHTFESNLIHANYGDESDDQAVGVELMVGSITSSNLKETVEQANTGSISGSNPLPLSAVKKMIKVAHGPVSSLSDSALDEAIRRLSVLITMQNPWIKRFESTTHGYAVMELTRNKATWRAYAVSTIKSRNARKSLLYECEIPRNQSRLDFIHG